jgi:hypothetical protein
MATSRTGTPSRGQVLLAERLALDEPSIGWVTAHPDGPEQTQWTMHLARTKNIWNLFAVHGRVQKALPG